MTKKQLIFDTFSLIYMGFLDFVSIVLLYVYPLIALLSLPLLSQLLSLTAADATTNNQSYQNVGMRLLCL